MPYVTIPEPPRRPKQITLEQLLSDQIDVFAAPELPRLHKPGTVTRFYQVIPERLARTVDPTYLLRVLLAFVERHQDLYKKKMIDWYDTFYIPKKSGGVRRIDAPREVLSVAQRELKEIFENDFRAMHHTSAYAYVKGRSTIDAIKRHQANQSKWFLKTDFSDFFGHTTMDFVLSQLKKIFPFSELMASDEGEKVMRRALSLCFLNGGLPQGTPISPMLTNLVMIPIDHELANVFHKHRCVYTRYADDILISCQKDFPNYQSSKIYEIERVLAKNNAPFTIKPAKTRYGSSAGSNWNLGVMLNKDNQITIGWKNVDRFKAMCHNYITDRKRNVRWDLASVQQFSGLISYYLMVERDYIKHIIDHYNQKYNVNMMDMLRRDLSGN